MVFGSCGKRLRLTCECTKTEVTLTISAVMLAILVFTSAIAVLNLDSLTPMTTNFIDKSFS